MHRVPASFNSSPRGAALFYGVNLTSAVISAAVILIPGAPLLAIALNANVLATVLLPVTPVLLMMLASDRELMGKWANTRVTNIFGTLVIIFIGLCTAGYGIITFLQTIHLIPD